MVHRSVLNFLSKKGRTQSIIMQFASALCTGSPSNHVVCLSPHVRQVRERKARYYWVHWILQRTILHCCIMRKNVRAVCFHVMYEERGKNNDRTSQTMNSKGLANLQAHGEIRNESELRVIVICHFWVYDITHISSSCTHECGSSSDGRRDM